MPIPRLNHVSMEENRFTLAPGTGLYMDPAFQSVREGVEAFLPGFPPAAESKEAGICCMLNAQLPPEGYALHCRDGKALMEASDAPGAVHAAAALTQFMENGSCPVFDARDEPRYQWRGLMMDVCRHFFPMETLYKLIDLTALYRMNRFHLHLSDDQGFRFESQRFPRLTEIGSQRSSSARKNGGGLSQDGIPHGGCYTKEELKKLVAYASARGVEIVPEVDLPGHASAMIASYPELSCSQKPIEVPTRIGVLSNLLCPGREETYAFLESLLEEIMEVFPFPYIHVGGDEAPKDAWKACPRCQEAMKANGLKDERELQGFMVNRLNGFLKRHGRRMIIWNDGLSDGLDTDILCQHWTPRRMQSDKRTSRHLNKGGQVIMSGFRYEYFDYPYALIPMKKAYCYKPLPKGTLPQRAEGVLGVECTLWTEWIADEYKLFYNLLPRMAAAAELMWRGCHPEDYGDFCRRLPSHYALYQRMGLPYAPGQEQPKSPLRRLQEILAFFTRETDVEILDHREK